MKNIHTMLDRSNLTPREKFLLLIQNDIEAHKTGKEVLTAADKVALENWQAHTNEEAREWNTLNDGWRYSGRLGIEGELHYHDAQAAHLQVRPIIMELLKYPLHREMRVMVENLKDIKKVTPAQAAEVVAKQRAVKMQDGMDYEYMVYRLAFERLSEQDRARMEELYADVTTDHQYLDQEEIIAHLLNGKETLTKAAKEKLAELIAGRSYNAFAKEHQLFHYFACIPLAEVARHFLAWKGVSVGGKLLAKDQGADDADMHTHKEIHKATEQYAKEHGVTIEELLKEGFMHWYDTEGFAYTPLIVSDDKELFMRWLKTKAAMRTELEQLISAGTLTIRARTPQETHKEKLYSKALYDGELATAQMAYEFMNFTFEKGEIDEKKAFETFSDRVITGESLYAWQTDLKFVQDFKERVDEYDPNLGLVYADDDPEHKGEHLDRELLICPVDSKGEIAVFSQYGLSLMRLERSFESVTFFKEERKGGKNHLKFKSKEVEHMFRDSHQQFIDGYSKLLAIKEITKKLSAIYETDMTFRLTILFARLDGWIEAHNEALDTAQKGARYKYMGEDEAKVVSEIDPTLYIDKDTISPDHSVVEEHTKKLKNIFYNF
ncbi:hypothetical protein A2949_00085 [Candidatus Adlerbacteria bacterium RIFCSPLOWO2_01_FULL_54_21b]|uniref:Uncharacterized protein n=1 Tax=Candidatus Adlerbacteria bacterium RIFCSPLOWO2_01_FULL_54_21b TaxID=1797245 RepID=A0A1F4XYB9_9BACT|nr:MAG: hypothetical protein A2949_00085 [Candidatus Adlerbacteria bacterium RIFCSPLOWO2_01_FULL_54_21b]